MKSETKSSVMIAFFSILVTVVFMTWKEQKAPETPSSDQFIVRYRCMTADKNNNLLIDDRDVPYSRKQLTAEIEAISTIAERIAPEAAVVLHDLNVALLKKEEKAFADHVRLFNRTILLKSINTTNPEKGHPHAPVLLNASVCCIGARCTRLEAGRNVDQRYLKIFSTVCESSKNSGLQVRAISAKKKRFLSTISTSAGGIT
jgi:hypothetical protein